MHERDFASVSNGALSTKSALLSLSHHHQGPNRCVEAAAHLQTGGSILVEKSHLRSDGSLVHHHAVQPALLEAPTQIRRHVENHPLGLDLV